MPFALQINAACQVENWFPYVTYAIKWNETAALPDAATVVSADGGRGLMQLTSSFPANWADPYQNVLYAIGHFLAPAETFWKTFEQGDNLIRCIAAEYNAGRAQAIEGHEAGNVDLYTTNNYGQRALDTYLKLLAGEAV
jgi:soluble lytic murein transglycosylase-like protein